MPSKIKKPFSFRKRALSFKFAFKGLVAALREQHNLRIHLVAAMCVVALGIVLRVEKTEWLILILCITIVIAAELFNSSIEYLTDIVSPEQNKQAGKVKDISAGAVLVTAIAAALIGIWIFLPKLIQLI